MPRDLPHEPAPSPTNLVARLLVTQDDEALDDAILLGELRSAVEGARTRADVLLRCHHPDWNERLGRIFSRYTG